ncbi:MAG: hypothetical protein U9R39_04470 [Campylobacterota bacterium]|nr:hypothetical protein [Campylobacterota bacterium]
MEQNKINRMVKAYIDQILMWLIIFIGFVTFLFLVIDYSSVMRIKGNLDLMSEYGARMVALDESTTDIADKLNNMKSPYFASIDAIDITCATTTSGTYQVIFNIYTSYDDTKVLDPVTNMQSRRVVFNDRGSDEIECDLTLIKQ